MGGKGKVGVKVGWWGCGGGCRLIDIRPSGPVGSKRPAVCRRWMSACTSAAALT